MLTEPERVPNSESADVELFRKLAAAWRVVQYLKDALATASDEFDRLEGEARGRMMSSGVQSVRVDGVTLYVQRQLWAKPSRDGVGSTDEAYDRACAALRNAGLAEFVHDRFNVQSLSAFFREEARNRDWDQVSDLLAPELRGAIELIEDYKVRARRKG